jgi:hypothetical protein
VRVTVHGERETVDVVHDEIRSSIVFLCSRSGIPCHGRLGPASHSRTCPSLEAIADFRSLSSHGAQNNAIDYVYTLETLASSGFIVAVPDHLNNTQDDARIDFINSEAGFAAPNTSTCGAFTRT